MSDNLESGEIMQLNKKDWNSKEAKDIAAVVAVVIFVVAAALVAAAAALVAAAIIIVTRSPEIEVIAASAIIANIILLIFAIFNFDPMRFPGAYLHYKRRIKS